MNSRSINKARIEVTVRIYDVDGVKVKDGPFSTTLVPWDHPAQPKLIELAKQNILSILGQGCRTTKITLHG